MDYVISEKLAQSVVNYLVKRPYDEVYQIIPSILAMKKCEEDSSEEEMKEEG